MNIPKVIIPTYYENGEGALSVIEQYKQLPFSIKRIYYIYQVPEGVKRGGHAHKKLQQLLFCPYGEIEIILNDGKEKDSVILNSPSTGILVTNTLWREMVWKKENSVLCVAASEEYNEDDYIRDYEGFLDFVKAEKRKENLL